MPSSSSSLAGLIRLRVLLSVALLSGLRLVTGNTPDLNVTLAIVALIYIVTGGHYTLYLIWNTFPRDMRYVFVLQSNDIEVMSHSSSFVINYANTVQC